MANVGKSGIDCTIGDGLYSSLFHLDVDKRVLQEPESSDSKGKP